MDDLTKFLTFLYEDKEGYVYVATKGQIIETTGNPEWNQEFFTWPRQQQEIHDYITLQGIEKDVYIAPALFKTKNSLKRSVKGSNVVWVEFDGQEQIDFQDLPKPDCIVQTSTNTHVHCYWKVPYIEDTSLIDNINRRLMYYLEADSSGWDASQVLRPPLSKNWKYNKTEGQEVVLAHFNPTGRLDYSSFDAAPEIKQEVILLNEEKLEDPRKLLEELPIHVKTKKKIVSEVVTNQQDRSAFLMRLGYELAEEGCNHLQIVSLLSYADNRIGKFTGRRDRLTRLSEIASIAVLNVEAGDQLVLYSPLEILNHKEELNWLIEGWMHQSGFSILTGPPGVGKTTLALQLLYHFTKSLEFLGKEVKGPQKILFISLEMGIIELKYTFSHHHKEFGNDSVWDSNIRVLDQEANLLHYEEILSEYEPSIVLIDSLTELAESEMKEVEARAVTRWIKRMRRRYNCHFICIHHNRKDTGTSNNKRPAKLSDLYGSFIFAKDVETVWNLERDDEGNIEIYTLKTRYDSKFEQKLEQNENLIFKVKETKVDSEHAPAIGKSGISFSFNQ